MVRRRFAVVMGLLVTGAILASTNTGRPEQPPQVPAQQEGTDVLARGPIHEAFAEPVDNQPKPGGVVPKQPPAPIEELPPDQKPAGDNVQWIPGYWSWDDDRSDFIWVSGIWRNDPPGRQWVPGHWVQTPDGWQWSAGFWGMQGQQQVELLPPPPAPLPAAASVPAPDNNSVFVPGTWVYQDTRYLWRPGYWVAYRPGWIWIPAHYVWTPAGFVFVDGYWDFELPQRGLLFAPVYIQPVYWTRPNWVYRPDFVVGADFLLGALFIRPGYNHYYFGDYFDADYRRRGFVTWVDFHRDRSTFDPLFSYYRWQHRDDRRWERDLRDLYAARTSGTVPRPPRTLVQQNTLIQNITVNRNVNVTNVTALTPLTKVDRTVVKLQPVSRDQQLAAQKSIQRLRQVSTDRARVETQIVATGAVPTKPADRPHVVAVDLPKPAAPVKASEKPQPPPPPVVHGRPQIHPDFAKPVTPVRPEAKPPAVPPKTEVKPQPSPPKPPEPKPPVKQESKPPVKQEPPKPPPKQEPTKPPAKQESKPPPPQPKPESKPPSPLSSLGSQPHAAKPPGPERRM